VGVARYPERFLLSDASLRRLTWPHPPAQACSPKPGPFNETEELAFLDELFELAHTVAAEFLIVKIYGVPGPLLAVQEVDRPGFRISGYQQEQQNRRREFNPADYSACSAARKGE